VRALRGSRDMVVPLSALLIPITSACPLWEHFGEVKAAGSHTPTGREALTGRLGLRLLRIRTIVRSIVPRRQSSFCHVGKSAGAALDVSCRKYRIAASSLLLATIAALHILDWNIHTDSPRCQSHALLFVHVHARVVPLEQGDVLSLRTEIVQILLSLLKRSLDWLLRLLL